MIAARRILDRLDHILDAVAAIERLTTNKTREEYTADPDLAAAVERYLERLSEGSRHIPDALKDKHVDIDWRGVADVGNVLRHAYDQVLDHRIWEIVDSDLASLKAAVENMRRDVEKEMG